MFGISRPNTTQAHVRTQPRAIQHHETKMITRDIFVIPL